MAITSDDVKLLREKTGCGMMDCKRALEEANGDMEKAVDILRKKGLATAAKKADRVAAEGIIGSYLDENNGIGVLVEINCETDFVAKNSDFKAFVSDIALHIAQKSPKDVNELLNQKYLKDQTKTVEELLKETIAKFGENTVINRFVRYESKDLLESYIHSNGKIGVLLEVQSSVNSPEVKTLVRDIALQIAASRPICVNREDVPSDLLEREKNVLREQALAEGKPENIIEKMVQGRLQKFYSDICLLDQPFIRDQNKKISDVIKEASLKFGGSIVVKRFTRYQIGEKS